MKMMKRILSAALALLICLTAGAALAEEKWVEDFQYCVLEDGTAEITSYRGPGKEEGEAVEVIVPGELDGFQVTGIGEDAFYICDSLGNVILPESVTVIGDRAFYVCNVLSGVTLPEGVLSIGASAFEECSVLTDITLPKCLTAIGGSAFEG